MELKNVDIDTLETTLLQADLSPLAGYVFTTGEILKSPEKCVKTHLTMLRANPHHKRFIPYYSRLLELYYQLKNK